MSPVALWVLLGAGVPPETLRVQRVDRLPSLERTAELGRPAVSFAGGRASVWLLGTADTIALYVAVRDSTESPADEVVVSLDRAGDAADAPQHDDFQWQLRRVLDSSVVSRGRAGRWQPPRDDPGWRLGPEWSGGGWEVRAAETAEGWLLGLWLDPAFLVGEEGRPPRLALRIYDGGPGGWYAWPRQRDGAHPTDVERTPSRWAPVLQGRD